jgi:monothiol glutaredoxin
MVDMDPAVREAIETAIRENPVILFMKGNPDFPMCGFSAKVSNILKAHDAGFAFVNVLEQPAVREGIKEYSDWPTIPQLYVNGELVGGCDIVSEMHENGELKDLLATVPAES